MAFDKVPSQLQVLYWAVAWGDIQMKLRLFVSEKQLLVNQQFQVMSQVVSLAFGGKSESRGGTEADVPKTAEQAKQMFAALKL